MGERRSKGVFSGVTRQILSKLPLIIAVGLIVMAAVIGWTTYSNSRTAEALLSLNYEEAYDGLNPNGTRFNIYDLKDDALLAEALKSAGISNQISVSMLSDSLVLSPVSSEKVDNEYIATMYRIRLTDPGLPRQISAESMLDILMRVYKEDFLSRYGTIDSNLDMDWASAEQWEYQEFGDILSTKVSSLLTYLNTMKRRSGLTQYKTGSVTFQALESAVEDFRDIHVNNYQAFVAQNRLFRSPVNYKDKLDYRAFLAGQDLEKFSKECSIRMEALEVYDVSVSTFVMVPMWDSEENLYMGRTATDADGITQDASKYVSAIKTRSKNLQDLKNIIGDIQDSNQDAALKARADELTKSLEARYDELVARIRCATVEYEASRSASDVQYQIQQKSFLSDCGAAQGAAWGCCAAVLCALCVVLRGSKRRDSEKV